MSNEEFDPAEEIFPPTVDLLLKWLDKNVKLHPALPGTDHQTLIYAQGRRDLVDELIGWKEEDNDQVN